MERQTLAMWLPRSHFNMSISSQVISNYRNGHTGQLSAVTVFLLAAGAVIRVFTSIQETGDRVVISTYIVSSAVNLLLLLQARLGPRHYFHQIF